MDIQVVSFVFYLVGGEVILFCSLLGFATTKNAVVNTLISMFTSAEAFISEE